MIQTQGFHTDKDSRRCLKLGHPIQDGGERLYRREEPNHIPWPRGSVPSSIHGREIAGLPAG